MIGIKTTGDDFKKTRDWADKVVSGGIYEDLEYYGRLGVDALARATPIDSGVTAGSWGYRIIKDDERISIEWFNTSMAGFMPIVILLQYGHATGTGGYVVGYDFINPAMVPIFEAAADDVWEEVTE